MFSFCPFTAVALHSMHADRGAHAETLAMAFATAHQLSDVFAALRFEARRSGELNVSAYLEGKHFGIYSNDSRKVADDNFAELRDLAHAYLEG